MKRLSFKAFIYFISATFIFSNLAIVPAFAGKNKWKKILGIAAAAGAGAAIYHQMKKNKKRYKKKYYKKYRKHGHANSSYASPKRAAGRKARRQSNRRLQKALTARGFSTGGTDGVMGRQSRRAIRAYQRSMGYRATGRLKGSERKALLAGLGGGAVGTGVSAASYNPSKSSYDRVTARHPEMNELIKKLSVEMSKKTGEPVDSELAIAYYNEFTNPNRTLKWYELNRGSMMFNMDNVANQTVGSYVRDFVKKTKRGGRSHVRMCQLKSNCDDVYRNAAYAMLATNMLIATTHAQVKNERGKLIATGVFIGGLFQSNPRNKYFLGYKAFESELNKSIEKAMAKKQYLETYGWMDNLSSSEKLILGIGALVAITTVGVKISQYLCKDGGCAGGYNSSNNKPYQLLNKKGEVIKEGNLQQLTQIQCRSGRVRNIYYQEDYGRWDYGYNLFYPYKTHNKAALQACM